MDSSIFCCCCENSDFTIYYIQNAWSASSCCIWEYGSWTSADFIFVCIRCIPYRLRKEDEEEKDDLENRIEVVMVSSPNRTDLVFPKVWPCLFHQVFRTQTVIVAVLLPICLFGSCPSFFQFPSFLLLSGWMGRWWDCVRSCLQRSHRRSRSERYWTKIRQKFTVSQKQVGGLQNRPNSLLNPEKNKENEWQQRENKKWSKQ